MDVQQLLNEMFGDVKIIIRENGEMKADIREIRTNQGHDRKEIDAIKSILEKIPTDCAVGRQHEEVIQQHLREHVREKTAAEKKQTDALVVDSRKDQKRFGWGGFIMGLLATLIAIASWLEKYFKP